MDWKIEQQRREKKQALGKNESARSVNILGAMEREFTQIFGEGREAGFSASRDQTGGIARVAEASMPCKAPESI